MLRLSRITKRFGPLTANDRISFEVRRGEVVGLLGENGAGKTTLMNILFGHYVADEGEIEAFGRPLPAGSPHAAIRAGIGMVHQHLTLAENLTVLDNIALGTEPLWRWRSDSGAIRRKVQRLAQDFGLEIDPDARVGELSVGERQRTEILKALYREARILILDEPTAVLTPQESTALFGTLKKLVAQGLSIIFISHKLAEVLEACHRILVLRAGQLTAERTPGSTNRAELAQLMVGREISAPKVEPQTAGEAHLRLNGVTVRGGHGRPRSTASTWRYAAARLSASPAFPTTGRARSPTWSTACSSRAPAGRVLRRTGPGLATARHPRARRRPHSRRSPCGRADRRHVRDRECRGRELSAAGAVAARLDRLGRGPALSRRNHRELRREVPISGGGRATALGRQHAEAHPRRVLSQAPRFILANQPTRGLDARRRQLCA